MQTGSLLMCGALLLYVLSLGPALAAAAQSASPVFTARVHSRGDGGKGSTLLQALQDNRISSIIILPDRLDVARELEGLPTKFPINRNVTVSGARGTDTVLDQQFQRARLQLCGSCTWTFKDITVANDSKVSAAGNELFVAAELGARVVLQDAAVLRLACPSPADTLAVLTITPRSAAFKHGQTQQQHSSRDVSIQGVTYPDALFAQSFSTDVAPSQEGRSAIGGYALLWKNTGRPCTAYVPTSCLDSKSMDACTQDLTDSLLTANSQRKEASGGLPPATLAVAVAVPVAVAALAAAGVGFWCWRRNRRPKSPKTFSRRKREVPEDLFDGDTDVETGSERPNTSPECSGGPIKADGQPLRRPLGLQAGWSVAKACTTPYLGQVDDDRIEFGELIGSGSFGRVYQAKWAGRDVAVKVIEHNTDTTVPVEREVTLMLSFNHPNVVRAFHFVTRVHTSEVTPLNASRDHELMTGSSTGSRTGAASTSTRTPTHKTLSDANMSLAAVAGNPHAAAAVAAAAAVGGSSSGGGSSSRAAAGGTVGSSGSGGSSAAGQPVLRTLPPHPHSKAAAAVGGVAHTTSSSGAHTATGSNNSRCSAGAGSDKPSAAGSIGNPQLQLVQRLPSLTGGTPQLVHKVETWLVQEYCDCGTLAAVASEWKHEPESNQKMLERLQLLQDCARGLKELHSRNVVHGDLNSRNVLLSSSGVTTLGVVAKLADLGLSRIVRSHRSHHSTNTVGTMSHVAPELLRYGHMSTAGDIYAFGIMMWELYTGQAAFRKLHVGQFFEAIVVRNLRPMIPRGMAADYQLLMQSCWSANPTDRPSCDRLLNCLKLMVEVREERMHIDPSAATSAAAAAAAVVTPHSPQLFRHQQQAMALGTLVETEGSASGPGTFAGGYSAPPPSAAAALSDAALLARTPKHPLQQQQQQRGVKAPPPLALPQQQQLQGQTPAAAAAAAGGGGSGGSAAGANSAGSSPRFAALVQRSAYSTSAGGASAAAAASASAAASALPGLLALLKERAPQVDQQQLMRDIAGGRLHSSCPSDTRFPRSSPGGGVIFTGSDGMPRLTPINTGHQRGSSDSFGYDLPVGHSQSDPLPAHGALTASMQQQILMQIQQALQQQQVTERSSGSFHGFPEASGGSGGSSGMPTPLLNYAHPHLHGRSGSGTAGGGGSLAHVTPLTGVKYQYPCASGGSGSSKGGGGGIVAAVAAAAASTTAPLPSAAFGSGGSSGGGGANRRMSTGSSGSTGPLRLPGTSSLARSGSLGTSSRHWYWQRSPAQPDDLNPEAVGGDDDSKSVTDQDGPVGGTLGDDLQPGCPDVMAQVQMDNNWYV